ncbi:hypothetical protein IMZ48_31115 [Candidatus Bathyarchaeota archaeon]|nr:hypothetical protein [Candidatus Bathyarchaeota archaeon]
MAEPRRKRPKWIFWVLAIAAICGMVGIVLPFLPMSRRSAGCNPVTDPPIVLRLTQGLEMFKYDWGVYPPSSKCTEGAKEFGYQCLAYYLVGPAGNGWGKPFNQPLPFNLPSGSNSERAWGPYYNAHDVALETILDAFVPAKPILYFRFERDRDPPYDVRDNPVDPTGVNGFASQEHFELLVRPRQPKGGRKWVREDYLLICPGHDRLYGYVVEDKATGKMRPARPEEVDAGVAVCDDITNIRLKSFSWR